MDSGEWVEQNARRIALDLTEDGMAIFSFGHEAGLKVDVEALDRDLKKALADLGWAVMTEYDEAETEVIVIFTGVYGG